MSIGKNWLITHNTPKVPLEDYMDMWKDHCNYCNGQLERGKEGTEHFQVYIALKDNKRLSALKKLDAHAHFELVKKDNGASAYCMKEETRILGPIEWGKRPLCPASKTDWDQVWDHSVSGLYMEIPAHIRHRSYNTIMRIHKDHMKPEPRTEPKECFWIYGEPGVGKSRAAREQPHYMKLANKWWDSYKGEKVVVIDDLGDDQAPFMKNNLKLWADPWFNQPGEIKGGQILQTFDKLYVTSNFSPEECFTGITLRAIKRRFKVIHMTGLPVEHTD